MMTFSKKILKLTCVASMLFLIACATPSAKEIIRKTDVNLINAEECVSSLSELQAEEFMVLDFEYKSTIKVDENSKCILSGGEPSYFAAYVLPEFTDKGFALEVQSRVIKTQLVFLPDIYLLDSNLDLISKTDGNSFKYRQIKYEKTIFVNSNERDPKYVVFTTNPETVGDTERRRLVSSVSTSTGYGGYIVTGRDSVNEIFYTTQGEITVLPIKN